MKKTPTSLIIVLIALIALIPTGSTMAGTINIDFQSDSGSGTTATERGLIGKGSIWNPYFKTVLLPVRDDGTRLPNTAIVVQPVGGSITGDFPGGSTNNVHRDGILNGSGPLNVSITNLRTGVPLRLILYSNADGPWNVRATIAESGESKVASNSTDPTDLQNSVEGADYLVFEGLLVDENGILEINIENATDPDGLSRIAGLQIQGWLPGEDFPSKADLHLSKKKNPGYLGDDVYGGRQLQKITGQRRGKFFYRLQNDADVWANYGLRSKGSDGDAIRKWFDLQNGRTNITEEVVRGAYRVSLDPGEKRSLMGILRLRGGTRKAVSILRGFADEDKSVPYSDRNKALVKP